MGPMGILGRARMACLLVALAAAVTGAVASVGVSPGFAQAGEDVELRLRRAAQALVAVEEELAGLQAQLDRERGRVVGTEVERDLNRDTLARLEQALGSARSRRLELKADVERLQKEREASRRPVPPPAPPPAPAPQPSAPAARPEPVPGDIARALQTELGRVGCDAGAPDGVWGPASQQALREYNRHTKSNHEGPTAAALEELRDRKSRICPLTCRAGFKLEGERCVAVEKPPTSDDDKKFALIVCNRSRSQASVAISASREFLGREFVSGWYSVPSGECEVIGRWGMGPMRWMAVDFTNYNRGWRGDATKICVPRTAFSRERSGSYTCGNNEKLEGFNENFVASKSFTITLNP